MNARSKPFINLLTLLALLISLVGSAIYVTPAHAASIVVNSSADNTTAGDNNCTLREAINNAEADADTTSNDCVAGSGADVITFNAALNGTPITLDGTLGQLPAVTTTITINGNGTANTIIQANAAANTATYRVFGVSSGGTLTLDGLTVRNGVSDFGSGQSGGGIYNSGTLTLTNSQISGNYVKGVGSNGGGIYNNGTLTLTNSTVSGNHADEITSQGGGIYNNGTLIISGSTISNNSADGIASHGGGISNHDAMTITDSIISGNHANGTVSSGGGIYTNGTKSVSITNSTVSSNQATGGSGLGGGIVNGGSPLLTITDSTISSNSATSYGGVYNYNVTLTITGSTINDNTATSPSGGGIASIGPMTITNSTIAGNDGGGSFGGGINYAGSTTSTLTNVTISGNTAGIFVSLGTLNLTNSIVANQIGGGDCAIFSGGLITSGGYNIEGGTSCNFTNTGDQQSVTSGQLNLGALADNGGSTQTMALGSGSVALDAGNNTVCAASPVNNVDQRGAARDALCDIGAYELLAKPDLTVTKTGPSTVAPGGNFNWVLTIINATPGDQAQFSNAGNVVLNDDMPALGSYSGTPTIVYSAGVSGTIVCTVPTPSMSCTVNTGPLIIPAGETITITVPVDAPIIEGTVLTNPEAGVCRVDPLNLVVERAGGGEVNNNCAPHSVTVTNAIIPIVTASNPSASAVLTSLSSITVVFNQDMLNDSSAKAANNTVNYILVERGTNGTFDTTSCNGGVVSDDVQQTISSASYNSAGFITSLTLASSLAAGTYRLFVCGTTSIWSVAGIELYNGANDYTVDFTISAAAGTGTGTETEATSASSLPATGFAPKQITTLPPQPADLAYANLGDLWLEIPSLNVKSSIVGVPQNTDDSWDVSWLGNNTGWLNGTAFPTWNGNSVLTAHVTNASGLDGPFAALKSLRYGEQIIVHFGGAKYIYELRNNRLARPYSTNFAFQSLQDHSYLTLITCQGYNPLNDTYLFRRVVRAVLVEVK